MLVELKISADLYKEDKQGNAVLLKKNVVTVQLIDTFDIKNPQQVYNEKGNIIKGKCKVLLRDIGPAVLNHPYEYIKGLKKNEEIVNPIVQGFMTGFKTKVKTKTKKE